MSIGVSNKLSQRKGSYLDRVKDVGDHIAELEEKNKIKKMKEDKDVHKKQIEEREKGFSVYHSGANEIKRRDNSVGKLGERSLSRGDPSKKTVRRQWHQPKDKPVYQNPFESALVCEGVGIRSPPKINRQKWGAPPPHPKKGPVKPEQLIVPEAPEEVDIDDFYNPQPLPFSQNKDDEIEEVYSDSFDEDETEGKQNMETFLQMASNEELDILKKSISNMPELLEQEREKIRKKEEYEQDFIEEEFEEDCDSDDSFENNMNKFEQEKSITLDVKRYVASAKPGGATHRPISASFNLAKQQQKSSQGNVKIDSVVLDAIKAENESICNTSRNEEEQEILTMQKASMSQKKINTNPFKRPFSQATSKRPINEEKKIIKEEKNLVEGEKKVPNKKQEDIKLEIVQKPGQPVTNDSWKSGMTVFLKKIENMDCSQRNQLVEVLERLEQGSVQSDKVDLSFLQKPEFTTPKITGNVSKLPDLPITSKSVAINPVQQEVPKQVRIQNVLKLRVLSTWGHVAICGLTELELYSITTQKIQIAPAQIIVKNLGAGPQTQVAKLFSGDRITTNEKSMWTCYMPNPPDCLEVTVCFKEDLGAIRIWNYNKSLIESTKGVRDIEVLYNDELVYTGLVRKGCGNDRTNYSSVIYVKDIILVPKVSELLREEEIKEEEGSDQERYFDDDFEENIPNHLQQIKDEAENTERPDTVPIWLQDPSGKSSIQPSQKNAGQSRVMKDDRRRKGPSGKSVTMDDIPSDQSSKTTEASKRRAPATERYKNPFQGKEQQVNDALSQVKNAVKLAQSAGEKGSISALRRKKDQEAKEEQLDQLEYFKMTNRGRIAQGNRNSIGKQGKNSHAHAITKSPFPKKKIEDSYHSVEQQKRNNTNELDSLDQHLGSFQTQPKVDEICDPIIEVPSYENPIPEDLFTDSFYIPYLPCGKQLQIKVLKTWGDMHYVGLSGIEIFNNEGVSILIEPEQIKAYPPDINILPGYGNDPRTVDKLVNGQYLTKDDLHVWLAPFTPGQTNEITIDFTKLTTISMIRLWNYNKNRIHSYRGVKDIIIQFDGKDVFRGEIQQAPGELSNPERCCEIILFSDEDSLMRRIDESDWLNKITPETDGVVTVIEQRPLTATRKLDASEIKMIQQQLAQQKIPLNELDERPMTMANPIGQLGKKKEQLKEINERLKATQKTTGQIVKGRKLEFNIKESWGDQFYVGLSGLEILDKDYKPMSIDISQVIAKPRDMNDIPGYSGDYRTLEKLFNGNNNVNDDHQMWLIPFNLGDDHTITITFPQQTEIKGIKFFNYNKSEEDSIRGVKNVIISLDGKLLTPKRGVNIKNAPGFLPINYDIGHFIGLPVAHGWSPEMIGPIKNIPTQFESLLCNQVYECSYLPMGFIIKINMFSNYGDFHYIGLNGIEIYDQTGTCLTNSNSNNFPQVYANPHSVRQIIQVNSLSGMENDIRTPDKLLNGINNTFKDDNMWMSELVKTKMYQGVNKTSKSPNMICLSFERPIAISAIKLWNYSKNVKRGVHEFEIQLDERVIYRGFMRPAMEQEEHRTAFNKDFSSSVIFSHDQKIITRSIQENVYFQRKKEQSVLLYNEKKLMNNEQDLVQKAKKEFSSFDQMERPVTSVLSIK